MYSALFKNSPISFDWHKISTNFVFPFSYMYLIRFFILSYWSFSWAWASKSSSSFCPSSSSFWEIWSFVSSISETIAISCVSSDFCSDSAASFCFWSSSAFCFVSSISAALTCVDIPRHNVPISKALIIFFPFIICTPLSIQYVCYYTFRCFLIVKKLPTKPIPTPKRIPTGKSVLYTCVTGRKLMIFWRRWNFSRI